MSSNASVIYNPLALTAIARPLPVNTDASASAIVEERPSTYLSLSPVHSVQVPATAGLQPSTFLSLLPVHGESFPSAPATAPIIEKDEAELALEQAVVHHRRTSSISSSSSAAADRRQFLKLAPVYWGGVPGEIDFATAE